MTHPVHSSRRMTHFTFTCIGCIVFYLSRWYRGWRGSTWSVHTSPLPVLFSTCPGGIVGGGVQRDLYAPHLYLYCFLPVQVVSWVAGCNVICTSPCCKARSCSNPCCKNPCCEKQPKPVPVCCKPKPPRCKPPVCCKPTPPCCKPVAPCCRPKPPPPCACVCKPCCKVCWQVTWIK